MDLSCSKIINTNTDIAGTFLKYDKLVKKIKTLDDQIDSLINHESPNKTPFDLEKFISEHQPLKAEEQETKVQGTSFVVLKTELSAVEEENVEKSIVKPVSLGGNIKPNNSLGVSSLVLKPYSLKDLKVHAKKFDEERKDKLLQKEYERLIKCKEENIMMQDVCIAADKSLSPRHSIDKGLYIRKKEYSKMLFQNVQPARKADQTEVVTISPVKEESPIKKKRRIIFKPKKPKNENIEKIESDVSPDSNNLLPPIENRSNQKSPSPIIIKTPLVKKPDYLTESRIIKESMRKSAEASPSPKKWNKLLNSNKAVLESIQSVKILAEELERKAKMKEQLMKVKGTIDTDLSQQVSTMLIDSIHAKLAILNKVNSGIVLGK